MVRWIKSSLVIGDLLGFDEVQFRFTFTSDATVNYDGYAIDDFKITTEPLAISDLNNDNFQDILVVFQLYLFTF